MQYLVLIACLLGGIAHAQEDRFWEGCTYIKGFSVWAYRMVHEEKVPEDRFHIADDDQHPEEREMARAIVHDVYHDIQSLIRRIERACANKEGV